MKLSDIKGERALDVIAEILEPIGNIATDNNAKAMFTGVKPVEGELPSVTLIKHWKKKLPKLIKLHKDDLITILATLNDTTCEEYKANMTLLSLMNDCMELLTDNDMAELFTSAQSEEQE